jgi:subtilase family serine protease
MARRPSKSGFVGIEPLENRVLLSATPRTGMLLHPTFRVAHHAGVAPASTTAASGITPAHMRQAYAFNGINFGGTAGNGSGQTIAIVDAFDDPNAASDLHNFDQAFGLADPPSFIKLNERGGTALPGVDNTGTKPDTWELEESLDIEWAHVMAPGANIILYEAQSSSLNDLIANSVNAARNNPNVSVISMSFGGDEQGGETAYDPYFTTPAGHRGITFLASTGDSGSPGGYPAYSPNIVSVGGTSLSINSAGNYLSESGWGGSGGGQSILEAEPAFQRSVQNSGARSTPDVSMDADPNHGVPVYDSYDNGSAAPWIQIGGTSLASPMFAGLIAVADQGRAINGLSSLDGPSQMLPMIYSAPTSNFHDITRGNNGGFSATVGYDLVTGRGSPVADQLVPTLAGEKPVSSSIVALVASTQGGFGGANADGAQQSIVSGITLKFSSPVSLTSGALSFSLRNTGGSGANDASQPVDLSADLLLSNPSSDGMTWLVSFVPGTAAAGASGTLNDGIYDLTVHAAGVTTPLGAVFADQTLTFHSLFGDVDGNKTVSSADYQKFKAAFGSLIGQANFDGNFDFDGNGKIDSTDYLKFKANFGKTFSY